MWDQQAEYVEVWCEKDAISGILREVTENWDVPLYVTRGYSSETFLYNAAETLKTCGKRAQIYYFGDLDPSGWNISQKIEERLREFGAVFNFERVAVHRWQVAEWKLPTRPVKRTDTRLRGWGDGACVEIDAIPANRLRALCEQAITRHIDQGALNATRQAETLERQTLERLAVNL